MRLTTKLILVFTLLLLASSLLFTHGCSGKASGGCPDNTAPTGSKITGPSTLAAPFVDTSSCYPALGFTVTDDFGNPLSDICVEIYSDASIALHSGLPDCSNVAANPQSAIVTRTDSSGNVIVELLSGPTPTGLTHFVAVSSGAINFVATTKGAQ